MNKDFAHESQLPWTGERYIPELAGEIQLEHVHRYLLALEYAQGKDVLDIACGEGFGSAILAKSSRSVIGVDIAREAVEHAAHRYRLPNVKFQLGSCAEIPLKSKTIDLVVSFETIEHHDQHQEMMAEIKRVLRPDGILIISSPDKKEYATLTNYSNPFHVKELFKEEFLALIRAYFNNSELISQRIVCGSGIIPEKGGFVFNDYNIKDIAHVDRGLARPRYLIAIASDGTLPVLSGGLLEQTIEDSEIVKGYAAEKDRQVDEIAKGYAAEKDRQVEIISELRERVRDVEEQSASKVRQLESDLLEVRRLHGSMSNSLSWRLTAPLRAIFDASASIRNRFHSRSRLTLATYRRNDDSVESGLDPRTTQISALIRNSGLFDADAYDAVAQARAQGLDPAVHYVLFGEARGLKPSPVFDPIYYGELYPDVETWGGNHLLHFLKWGRQEGRRSFPVADTLTFPLEDIVPDKPTVLVVIHEASRTGAPILGWNIARGLRGQANVVAILLREGPLEIAFAEVAAAVVGPISNDLFEPIELMRLARRLAKIYRPIYVIANSTETRALVPALADEGVPAIALVHEFSASVKPAGSLQLIYERAQEVVFPADIVRRSSEIDYPFLKLRHTHILPQGPSVVPRSSAPVDDPKRIELEGAIRSRLRPEGAADHLVVVGMGSVAWRKGVDLFIATATAVLAREPQPHVRFIWVGDGYGSPLAEEVSSYLSEQIRRSSLGDRFDLMDAVDDIESIYKETDVLFLSSRLDPLPNVSIDAVLRGIPVVCFAEASGMAEILISYDGTRELVVPHLDVGAAATLLSSFDTDRNKLRRLGNAVRVLGQARFNMEAYLDALDKLGKAARQNADQEAADAMLILTAGAFDAPLYLGDRAPFVKLPAAVREYVTIAAKYNYARAPLLHQACTRRPLAGFHPVTYALQSPNYNAEIDRDPLAHYLRAERPQGPWTHRVIRIEAEQNTVPPLSKRSSTTLRVILHAHFYYTDHVGDFMRALTASEQQCELILTTNSSEKAAEIRSALKKRTDAEIRIFANRGRDIGPCLKVLEEAKGRCDLFGHFHGKRSPHADRHVGDRWRTFLWQHLIGDRMPMIDILKQVFVEDAALGLVFPEDPFLVGWDGNREIAQMLAARMGLRAPLPATIECPVGTMFWARPEALAPLLRLHIEEDEYPNEPLPIDGTMLHAIERLLPLVVEDAGYSYATTYLPHFVR
jgi:2-polyprenyl-3-methyl-5-hydroxy-6-metoxy-1,4-benzoquinol methylase/glycosyltransferase involved in cell wall biosynthesis